MNLLQKLTDLMQKNGDTVASLSRKSGIPYTTIDGLFKKGFAGTRISTIQAIGRTYGVSMDYLILDEIEDPQYGLVSTQLLPSERRLLSAWRNAEASAREIALETLENHPAKQDAELLA